LRGAKGEAGAGRKGRTRCRGRSCDWAGGRGRAIRCAVARGLRSAGQRLRGGNGCGAAATGTIALRACSCGRRGDRSRSTSARRDAWTDHRGTCWIARQRGRFAQQDVGRRVRPLAIVILIECLGSRMSAGAAAGLAAGPRALHGNLRPRPAERANPPPPGLKLLDVQLMPIGAIKAYSHRSNILQTVYYNSRERRWKLGPDEGRKMKDGRAKEARGKRPRPRVATF
jgi:hypothetical protein